MTLIARLFTRWTVWCSSIFYRFERVGADLPHGPTLIIANHSNMLIDPALVLHVVRRTVRTLVKAPHFRTPIFGSVLRALGALPVYRMRDDPRLLARNKSTIHEAVDALGSGDTLLIFPEGGSDPSASLRPLKAGAARIALTAEAKSDWSLGLSIVPIGLAYRRRDRFRGRALAAVGQPLRVSALRGEYEKDRARAIRRLTNRSAAALESLTLNLQTHSDIELVETIDLLQQRARGARRPELQRLAERIPRLRRIARRLDWLRSERRESYECLASSLGRYAARQCRLLGRRAGSEVVDLDGIDSGELRRRGVRMLIEAPVAALGSVLWSVPYLLAGLAVRILKPEWETTATVKLLAGVVLFPLAYLVWLLLAGASKGIAALIVTAVALPPLLLFTIRWHDRHRELLSDICVLLRVRRRPQAFRRLARQAQAAQLHSFEGGDER